MYIKFLFINIIHIQVHCSYSCNYSYLDTLLHFNTYSDTYILYTFLFQGNVKANANIKFVIRNIFKIYSRVNILAKILIHFHPSLLKILIASRAFPLFSLFCSILANFAYFYLFLVPESL